MGDTEQLFRPQRCNRKRSTVASTVDKASLEKVKPYGERIQYTKDVLLALREKHSTPLFDVSRGIPDEIRTEDSAETQATIRTQSTPKRETKDAQEDWHSGKKAVSESVRQPDTWDHKPLTDKNAPVSYAPQVVESKSGSGKIQTAVEMGRQAYRPGGAVLEDRAFRGMVSIINKLTPENYDRLSLQLIDSIGDSKLLQQTLSFTFDNAVKQPSYCGMYAKLCRDIENRLPSAVFGANAPTSTYPVKFMLLNTCQDEIEKAVESYKQLSSDNGDIAKVEETTVSLRKRIIGIVRLICEIYLLSVLPDKTIFEIFSYLQSEEHRRNRYLLEDTIEAVCEALSMVGFKLASSTRPSYSAAFKTVITTLGSMLNHKLVSSRVRFCIEDILELSRKNWVSGKEFSGIKKISEINTQAKAELGLVNVPYINLLPVINAQQKQAQSNAREQGTLIPQYKGSTSNEKFTGGSALIGDFKDSNGAGASVATVEMTREDVLHKSGGLYDEYLVSRDMPEAITCIRELSTAGADMSLVLESGIKALLNLVKESEQMTIINLFLEAYKEGLVQSEAYLSAFGTFVMDLPDLFFDVPLAPKLLGQLYGSLAANKIIEFALSDVFSVIDDVDEELKRSFSEAALAQFEQK
mmetsp:Transcript_27133/g.49994  ORF Transcript_27133/g.49994 Transcript_27133/m.49994 type:complete len:637 (-) Transcript_27133:1084-2994(-)|eukprot:CAMPEP_0175072450 /NCGR_PEP_ID=MMETSP0052_2-20121109/19918_1 /TAXON_ID=51329 ORGANISM="Polytomella parva, Strain SAG 63-3" /NCGR_SAMPLE_ID=MMETSP0052_2 /ASSEMBLY_ACC=CAM_ASM_000194 /LENGTH=636 /DNA_ID=CAMNT_0016339959 /DNA_START=64 /DNA_END=1974 /DNA_ORIENTATION=-